MIKTASVVVFIPPPVDAGDAPINIKIIITNTLLSRKVAKSSVLKPAVLAVTDWNIADSTFPFKGKSAIVAFWLNSIRKINNAPTKISVAVENNTTLECTFNFENLLFLTISSTTGNPSPPSTISAQTVIDTVKLFT